MKRNESLGRACKKAVEHFEQKFPGMQKYTIAVEKVGDNKATFTFKSDSEFSRKLRSCILAAEEKRQKREATINERK